MQPEALTIIQKTQLARELTLTFLTSQGPYRDVADVVIAALSLALPADAATNAGIGVAIRCYMTGHRRPPLAPLPSCTSCNGTRKTPDGDVCFACYRPEDNPPTPT